MPLLRLPLALFALLFLFSGPALAPAYAAGGVKAAIKADEAAAAEDKADTSLLSLQFEKIKSTFLVRFALDVVSAGVLIGLIYYPAYRKKEFLFTFFMFNVTIFFITYLLSKVDMSTGAAFGLFAVFSLLRYRTVNIMAKDMTYLFTVIAIGLLSSVEKASVVEIAIVNATIVLVAFLLDGNLLFKTEEIRILEYDSLEKIKPEHYKELLKELQTRTGLNIHKFEVGRIDYLRDMAVLRVYYYGPRGFGEDMLDGDGTI